MIAVAAGLTAAVVWGVSGLCASRVSAVLGVWPTVGWVMALGLGAIVPFLLLGAGPGLRGQDLVWFVVAGMGNVLGLAAVYRAMRSVAVSVVVAIGGAEGAIAAILGIVGGSRASTLTGIGISLVLLGVLTVAYVPERADTPAILRTGRAPGHGWAIGAASMFGFALYATNRLALSGSIAWAVAPPRILGTLFIAAPLALTHRLPMQRRVVPIVGLGAMTELLGFVAVAVGSRDSLVVTDVLSSQFPVATAVGAFLFFRERLEPRERNGVLLLILGATLIALARG